MRRDVSEDTLIKVNHIRRGEQEQEQTMTGHPLVRHWQKLKGKTPLNGKDVYVHPDDMDVFRNCATKHSFNFDYPPPAYVGDIVNAPVVMLLTNGGYSDGTQNEFSEQGDAERYLKRLHDPSLMRPEGYSQYYRERKKSAELLEDGKLAIVNAVAYRSPGFTDANRKIANKLESVKRHRRWLKKVLLPAAADGKRFVIAHRYTHWQLNPEDDKQDNLYFSKSQRNSYMEHGARDRADEFLASLKSSAPKPRR